MILCKYQRKVKRCCSQKTLKQYRSFNENGNFVWLIKTCNRSLSHVYILTVYRIRRNFAKSIPYRRATDTYHSVFFCSGYDQYGRFWFWNFRKITSKGQTLNCMKSTCPCTRYDLRNVVPCKKCNKQHHLAFDILEERKPPVLIIILSK